MFRADSQSTLWTWCVKSDTTSSRHHTITSSHHHTITPSHLHQQQPHPTSNIQQPTTNNQLPTSHQPPLPTTTHHTRIVQTKEQEANQLRELISGHEEPEEEPHLAVDEETKGAMAYGIRGSREKHREFLLCEAQASPESQKECIESGKEHQAHGREGSTRDHSSRTPTKQEPIGVLQLTQPWDSSTR